MGRVRKMVELDEMEMGEDDDVTQWRVVFDPQRFICARFDVATQKTYVILAAGSNEPEEVIVLESPGEVGRKVMDALGEEYGASTGEPMCWVGRGK